MSGEGSQHIVKRELTERMVSPFRRVKEDIQLDVSSRFRTLDFSRGSNPCISNSEHDQEKTFSVKESVKCSRTDR